MSYLLFLDESGHDHKNMPFEVHGGVALRANAVWPFITDMRRLQYDCFGALLATYGSEIKGSRLLQTSRFKWAQQGEPLPDAQRCELAREFLQHGASKLPQSRAEFTAYGQACLRMADGVFDMLERHNAVVFAVSIPKGTPRPKGFQSSRLLRKDHVYLFQRYYYFLEERDEHGLLVFDETERKNDVRLLSAMEHYFAASTNGRKRAKRIVPTPFFVASDTSYPVQAADVAVYCYNWSYRLPRMTGPVRAEIQARYASRLRNLECTGTNPETGHAYSGFYHVPDPYNTAKANIPTK